MQPKCPKCKNIINFFETERNEKGIKLKNPHWKCFICGLVGYKTTKDCPHCKKKNSFVKLVLSRNRLFCLGCGRSMLVTIETLQSDNLLPKAEEVEKDKDKKETKKLSMCCPKCRGPIYGSLTKISRKPIWCCWNNNCRWKGLKTNKFCGRCRNMLSFSKNTFECPYCTKPLFTVESLQETLKEMNFFQKELE